jgi:hypothetical protein
LTRQDKTDPAGLGETNNLFSLALGGNWIQQQKKKNKIKIKIKSLPVGL